MISDRQSVFDLPPSQPTSTYVPYLGLEYKGEVVLDD